MSKEIYLPYRGHCLQMTRRLFFSFNCFLVFLLSTQTVHAQLAGNYTIGGTEGDYTTFREAVEALRTEGVSGPVNFRVRPGTYDEQLSIAEFPGNSCENQVVFEGESGFRTDVILQAPNPSANPYTVQLNGADGIIFRNMSISGNGQVLHIVGDSDCITLENNILTGIAGEESGIIVEVSSGASNFSNHHTYRNNLFQDGTIGIQKTKNILSSAEASQMDEGLVIERNEFRNMQEAGINISGQKGYAINHNLIRQGLGSTGIMVANSWYGKEIMGNTIDISNGGSGIVTDSGAPARITANRITMNNGGLGMHISPGVTEQGEVLVANNIINVYGYEDNYEDIAFMGGLSVSAINGNAVKVFHNSVLLGGREEDDHYAFSGSGEANSLYILNNSFANISTGLAISIKSSAVAEMDYNNLFTEYRGLGQLDGTGIGPLAEWQSISGYDEHSISVQPDEDQLHEAFSAAGIFVEEVPNDIIGKTRKDPPSIGAYELGGESIRLSGIYTIGGEDADYASFSEAVTHLERLGVQDSVVFLVRPGMYREQLNINGIKGPVVFSGESKDSSDVVLEYPIDYAMQIFDASNLSFQNMTISGADRAVNILGSSNIMFENNVIESSGEWAVVSLGMISVRPRVYLTNRNVVFRNNRISGEGVGIDATSYEYDSRGGYLNAGSGIEITGNVIQTESTGISIAGQSGIDIRNNSITIGDESSVFGGVGIILSNNSRVDAVNGNNITIRGSGGTGIRTGGHSFGGSFPGELMNNRILLPDGGTGLHIDYGTMYGGTVANNMISVNSQNSSIGILINWSGRIDFYNNSVLLYGEDASSRLIHITDEMPEEISFLNNIFANTAGGLVFSFGNDANYPQMLASSDYNNLYTSGAVLANWSGEDAATLEDWQSLIGLDENSLSVDPEFRSTENLIPANPMLNGAGTALEEVNEDFFGRPRNNPPAIGAVEFEGEIEPEEPFPGLEPTPGLVSGGGWFFSPAGAISHDPSAAGRAIISLAAIQKGEDKTPKGYVNLTIPQFNFRFTSRDAFEWMSVSENMAILQGTGELNREEGYRFVVSVADEESESALTKDSFRIIIWNSQAEVVYDNQRGSEKYALASQPLGGGNIIIQEEVNAQNPDRLLSALPEAGAIAAFKAFPTSLDQDELWIEIPAMEGVKTLQLRILNMQGSVMAEGELTTAGKPMKESWKVDALNWPSGIYIFRIQTDGQQYQQKLLK